MLVRFSELPSLSFLKKGFAMFMNFWIKNREVKSEKINEKKCLHLFNKKNNPHMLD